MRGRRGAALVIVLWVLALLSAMAAEFALSMRAGARAASNFGDELSARALAAAGVEMGVYELSSGFDGAYTGENGGLVLVRKEGGGAVDLPFDRDFGLNAGTVTYAIEDESGKINVNTCSREDLDSLLFRAGIEKTERDIIVDSVLDWRDDNQEFRLNGAEDDYYAALPRPYGAKDGSFDTVEELLLVRGVTPELFYGKGRVPPEFGIYGEVEKTDGISGLLTVYGDGRVNLNTADKQVLSASLGSAAAEEVLLRRANGYIDIPAHGSKVSSAYFTVRAKGSANGLTAGARAVVLVEPGKRPVKVFWKEEGLVD